MSEFTIGLFLGILAGAVGALSIALLLLYIGSREPKRYW